MKTFDVQTIELPAPFGKTFEYIADAGNLPQWTSAFKSVGNGKAMMETPNGAIEVALVIKKSREEGTIDWVMTFPDGNKATAYSRVIDSGNQTSIYSFTLMSPPVPLEQLEGALEQQSQILSKELAKLAAILAETGS